MQFFWSLWQLVMVFYLKISKIELKSSCDDPAYQPMAGNFEHSIAFKAACDLVFEGRQQPSGYTEPVLHARRLQKKAEIAAS